MFKIVAIVAAVAIGLVFSMWIPVIALAAIVGQQLDSGSGVKLLGRGK